MNIALVGLFLLVIILVVALMWHRLGDPVEEPELTKMHRPDLAEMHEKRVNELLRAYRVAKEELDEEPTVDQIFLTRDQLRTQDALENDYGTT